MLNKKTIQSFEDLYEKGYDKSYPHIELVRLEKLFLDKDKKNTLDYGHSSFKVFNQFEKEILFCAKKK